MRHSIDNNLQKIIFIKQFNKNLRQNNLNSGVRIIQLKKRTLNCEKTLNTLLLLKTVHKTIPTINELEKSGRLDYAVNLLKDSEEIYL